MKKILFVSLLLFTACSNSNVSSQKIDLYKDIPVKNDINGVSIESSSVNTKNVDNYLFRDDTIYVDLRYYSWVIRDGHIGGFSFYSFYEFFASMEDTDNDNRLFSYKKESPICKVGSFTPNYVESEFMLNNLFPKDKNIFAISQSGLECTYFFNLLIQYGYDSSKLYNIGGFSNGTGLYNVAYINIDNPKHLVEGNPLLDIDKIDVTFDFMKELTPID